MRPRFWLRERRVVRTWEEVRAELDDRLATEEHFELFLNPYGGHEVLETTRTRSPEPTRPSPGDGERHPLIEIQASIPLVWVFLRLAARWFPSFPRTQFPRTLRRMEDPNYTQVSHRVFNIGAANHLPALSSELAVPVEGDTHLRAVDRIIEIADELARSRRLFHTSPIALRFVAPSARLRVDDARPADDDDRAHPHRRDARRPDAAGRVRATARRPGRTAALGSVQRARTSTPARSTPAGRTGCATYEQLNASGVFDSPFTDRIGISRRPR